ncbi:putative MFS-type transporter PB1E7.08c [Psilocybe cubensis]|uniref:MFS-type transporter PB1E7.08c n=2 Tax=Psilocybe cubensis TaxID=181762 RepID=A0ACB8GZ74_PSICU|nr:putative MFS-type transporter PB1E7.08c [Psilocybe cubensis]KAH9480727.1 putative MFS-type transporter PB1E7.08c [Psilocybe cubensis]
MASFNTPRNSLFWTNAPMASAYLVDDESTEQEDPLVGVDYDGRTPLDKTIDRIGMGTYQWTLLSLCGFGWMADNMWIQAIAIILPRIQQHYSVPDSYIGAVSSSMFAGMMLGAIGWGTCSDILGRSAAFNGTLFFTAIFGLMASFANSFCTLCISLFFLGSAVGGSMPTDGTLLLEHMPKEKQYLVTALSIFFSFGAVLSAAVSLFVLPNNSCTGIPCDVDTQNRGWKYLLITLGLITLCMFVARMVLFRLHESPRFLVHAGRPQDAIRSLQLISKFNGSSLSIELEDVRDHLHESETLEIDPESQKGQGRARATSRTIFDASIIEDGPVSSSPPRPSSIDSNGSASRPALITAYSATGENTQKLDSHTFMTPVAEDFPILPSPVSSEPARKDAPTTAISEHIEHVAPVRRRRLSNASRRSSVYEEKVCRSLPRWLRRPLWAWWDRTKMVLAPEWLRTTILVWTAWCAMSLAYTMFNVYLPKLLETRSGSTEESQTLEGSLWDVMIFTIGGCPGALLGAFLIESSLGRRWSLAGSTFVTAFFCILFVLVKATWAVRLSTVGISLSATAMWAVLYGWTPEIFGTKVRGTACGIASALSRIGGMIAPMLGGILLMMDRSVPVYTSVVIFAIAGFSVLLLREGEGDSSRGKSGRALIH